MTKHICLNTRRMKTQHLPLVHNLKSNEVWNGGEESCACHGVMHKHTKTPLLHSSLIFEYICFLKKSTESSQAAHMSKLRDEAEHLNNYELMLAMSFATM